MRITTEVETSSTNNLSNKTALAAHLVVKEVSISSNQQQLRQHITVKAVQAQVDHKVTNMVPVAEVMPVVKACHLHHLSTTMVIRSQAVEQWEVCHTMEVIKEVDLGQIRVPLEGHLPSNHLCMVDILRHINIQCMAWVHQTTVIHNQPLGWGCLLLNSKLKVVELTLEPTVHQHIRHLKLPEPRQTNLQALNLKGVQVVHSSNISRWHHLATNMADKFPKHKSLLEMDLTKTNNSSHKLICTNSNKHYLI